MLTYQLTPFYKERLFFNSHNGRITNGILGDDCNMALMDEQNIAILITSYYIF
jgi:hypothetical protein